MPNRSGTPVGRKDKQGRKRDPDRPELSEQGLFRTPVDIAPEAVPVGNGGNSVGKIVGNSSNNQNNNNTHTPKIPRQELVAECDADYTPPVTATDHHKHSSSSTNAVIAAARNDAERHDEDSSDDEDVDSADISSRHRYVPRDGVTGPWFMWDINEYANESFHYGDDKARCGDETSDVADDAAAAVRMTTRLRMMTIALLLLLMLCLMVATTTLLCMVRPSKRVWTIKFRRKPSKSQR